MIPPMLDVVQLGHPALRAKAQPVQQVDDALRELARQMLEAMYAHDGVGLAANQVGRDVRLIVLDVTEARKRPSALRIGGRPRNVRRHMPMALVNPRIELSEERETGAEGCLSIPGISADVERARGVRLEALQLDGTPIAFEAEGLLARVLQHEVDHLDGVLFIDRLSAGTRREIAAELQKLQRGFVG